MLRASDGKMRIDTGATSIITNPKTQQAIVLDHVSKEARILPMQPAAPPMGTPQSGAAAPSFKPPAMPAMQMQSLGKSTIEGQEVDGKRYVVQPPAPKLPQASPAPGMPSPKPPAPPMPTTVDVWTSSKLGLPVLTQVTGPFGQQTCYCKVAPATEPHPSTFQIPPGYKPVMPAAPQAPKS
jgi:hypothetical protein